MNTRVLLHRRSLLAAVLVLVLVAGVVSPFLIGTAQAQVGFDAAAEFERTLTTDPQTWSHNPVGTPRGVIVTIGHGTESTDCIVSVTYGGTAMSRVATAADTATEAGRVYVYFLGVSVPTADPATVSADVAAAGACSTTDMHFVSMSYTATLNTEVLTSATDAENQANPTATLSYSGRQALAAMVFYSGIADVSTATLACSGSSGCSTVHFFDIAAFGSRTDRQTTVGSTDQVMGYTVGTDDVAAVYVAITEIGTVLSTSCTSGPTPLTVNKTFYILGIQNYIRLTCTVDGEAYTTSGSVAATPTFSLPAPFTQLWSFESSTATGTTCAAGTSAWQMTSGSQRTFPSASTTWDYCAVIPSSATADSTSFTVAWNSP